MPPRACSKYGPAVDPTKGSATPSVSISSWACQGTAASSWAVSARSPSSPLIPGGRRRLRRALASAGIAIAEPTTGGASMPSTVSAGRAQSIAATLSAAGEVDAVENLGVGAEAPGRVLDAVPLLAVVEAGDRRLAVLVVEAGEDLDQRGQRVRRRAAEDAGVQGALQRPHRDDDVGDPAQGGGQGRHARARSCRRRRRRSRPPRAARGLPSRSPPGRPVPCSSEPSATSFTPTGSSSPSARSAVRWATTLPLQSALPRPYQRPSRSVSSKTGLSHSSSPSGGCTS